MKRFISMIIVLVTILLCASAFAETETVEYYEINGRMPEIFLNKADKKSASDSEKTQYFTGAGQKGFLKTDDRYKCQPWAVAVDYPATTGEAKVLYRNPDTELTSVNDGFKKTVRYLDGNGKRCDSNPSVATSKFQARLDQEGRKYDFVDYVVEIDGLVMSITHIRVSATQVNYYRVIGDARKAEPKKKHTTSSTTTPSTTTPTPNPDEDPVEPVSPSTPNPDEDEVDVVPPSTTTPPSNTNPPSTTTPSNTNPPSTTTPSNTNPPSNTPNPQEDEVILVPPQGNWGN